jgi:hypothetical protein
MTFAALEAAAAEAPDHQEEVAKSLSDLILAAHSQGRDNEIVVVMLKESTDLLTKERQPRGGGLTDEQARYLVESGAFTADELAQTEREVAAGALAEEERKTRLGALARTLSAGEVASKLGIDASRVRHRQAKGLLFGFRVAGKRRYPTWQFTEGDAQPLPRLATVIEAFPHDWHPAGIEAFMTTPKSSLRAPSLSMSEDTPERLTPAEWLESGGDPDAIVRILGSFLQS